MKRRIEITIETERVIMLESDGEVAGAAMRCCERCGYESRINAPESAQPSPNTQAILRKTVADDCFIESAATPCSKKALYP